MSFAFLVSFALLMSFEFLMSFALLVFFAFHVICSFRVSLAGHRWRAIPVCGLEPALLRLAPFVVSGGAMIFAVHRSHPKRFLSPLLLLAGCCCRGFGGVFPGVFPGASAVYIRNFATFYVQPVGRPHPVFLRYATPLFFISFSFCCECRAFLCRPPEALLK